MTMAAEIVAYLRERGHTEAVPALNVWIRGVATDQSAHPGEMAWIRDATPERLLAFRGSLLLGPLNGPDTGTYIGCGDPKLAFIEAVDAFFPHLAVTNWPASPQGMWPDVRFGQRVTLSAGVVIGSAVTIGDDVTIGPNTCLANARIGNRVSIGANCSIGLPGFGYSGSARFPHLGKVVIEDDVEIGSNTCIDRGSLGDTIIGAGSKIDNLVHVAHNVVLGSGVMVIANAMLGGSTVIGDGAWVAPSVAVMDAITIGEGSILGLGAVVTKSIPEREIWVGNPARLLRSV